MLIEIKVALIESKLNIVWLILWYPKGNFTIIVINKIETILKILNRSLLLKKITAIVGAKS
jgi:hypothetical protein